MSETKEPDGIIRFLKSDIRDPDRILALRVSNFLAGITVKQAAAVYALAISHSFRSVLNESDLIFVLRAMNEACIQNWRQSQAEPDGPPCEPCGGAGMIGDPLGNCVICEQCQWRA